MIVKMQIDFISEKNSFNMSQNEFINKPKNDIALSMLPLPAYPGPHESTNKAHQVPGDIVVVFGQHSVITTCKNCNNQVQELNLNV